MDQINEYKRVKELFEKYKNLATIKKHCTTKAMLDLANKLHEREKYKNLYDTSVRDFCQKLIRVRLKLIAASLPSTGYKMGDLRQVQFANLIGEYDDREYYSQSCKYKAQHGSVKVNLTLEELRNCQVIGGVVTFVEPGQKGKLKECIWIDSIGVRKTFKIERVKGWIYGNYHHVYKDIAIKYGRDIEKRDKERRKEEKQREKRYLEYKKAQKKAAKCLYSFADSIKAGNCETGTRLFARKFNLDVTAIYTGNYLLKLIQKTELAYEYERYINRMINDRATQILNSKK